MKKVRTGLLYLLLSILAGYGPAFASGEISEQTFARYSNAAGLERQYQQMIGIFSVNFQQAMVSGFQNSISGQEMPTATKEKLYPLVREASKRLKDNFERLFRQELSFADLSAKVYLPVYRKHFTEAEIVEIIKFYQSPVGKKLAELTPVVLQESAATFNQLYGQKVQAFGGELLNQEINTLLQQFNALKGKKD